mmetsp:Transcript_30179/g.46028  ORF Transcript_30179/g.46028 Transcript_30179/m.46028 type:complete len:447 (-) Transcript_30179:1160-2500(-)
MDSVEGSRPIILQSPSCFHKRNSEAKRRWGLLRNLAVATRRRTSLTPKEEEFLKHISKPDPTTASCTDEERKLFLGVISDKAKLTAAEHTFLSTLVDSHHVTDEQLENVRKVLEKDPIFQHDTATKQDNKREKREPSQRSASFRQEVWTEYESLRHVDEDIKKESMISPPSQPSSLGAFLASIFGRGKEEKTEDVVEEDLNMNNNVQEMRYSILAASGKDPDCQPNVLSPPMMNALRKFLPFAVSEDNFWLKYSMIRDGAAMRALLKQVRSSARTVIAIETMDGDVFGSFTSSPWRPNGKRFYGNGESFLWKVKQNRYTECNNVQEQIELEKDIDVFKWSGKNYNIQALVSPDDDLVIGSGGDDQGDHFDDQGKGSGLMINSNLERGVSDGCLTFDSPRLNGSNTDALFEIANVEVWTLTPVESLDKAKQLELGRQFLFDHGNFAL